ncbi:hypothetical protein [Methylogaea oryzae]|uniref:hypothetical protein n=1 Tax=Methylogaea oryzae TaxID=1295382 RepID=UPI00278BCA00
MLDEHVHDAGRHVDGDGEADADVAAGGGEDGGVDADQLAAQVDQAPPELPGLMEASVWMKSS